MDRYAKETELDIIQDVGAPGERMSEYRTCNAAYRWQALSLRRCSARVAEQSCQVAEKCDAAIETASKRGAPRIVVLRVNESSRWTKLVQRLSGCLQTNGDKYLNRAYGPRFRCF